MSIFMGGRFIIFHHLLNSENKQEDFNMLKEVMKKIGKIFVQWAKETIKIGEEDLGQTFPDDFKELFE